MIDITKKPFYLTPEAARWVEQTLQEMTTYEKIAQLFVLLKADPRIDADDISQRLKRHPQGGLRWQGGDSEKVYTQNRIYQEKSRIPLLIAANCDNGGDGCLPEGTFVATAAQAASGGTDETAYHMGFVSAKESTSIGCNWLFNPVADIYMNWRNTIVNTRCFGDNPDQVIRHARAYVRGVKAANPNMACCIKHFPGDGVEELDQHLVMGVNTLSVDDWEDTYGKVYRTLIEDGIESVMVGHIALPAMSRHLSRGIRDHEIHPATLAPELIDGLLRKRMGFNGLVITDATHMIGFSAKMKREDALVQAIASGIDMILFANDADEDFSFVEKGLSAGLITEERLDDAVTRILALKAKVGLNDKKSQITPEPEMKDQVIGCAEHLSYVARAAEECITLVKDTQNLLPLAPEKKKRALLIYAHTPPGSRAYNGDSTRNVIVEEMEQLGFQVDVMKNFYDLEIENGVTPRNFMTMMEKGSLKSFSERYDVAFLFLNFKGYAEENNVRVKWSLHHSKEMPWYISEVPTVGISLNYTNHLIDVPQIRTFINAYGSTRDHIRTALEKVCGKSEFKGTPSHTVFCGRWETRL